MRRTLALMLFTFIGLASTTTLAGDMLAYEVTAINPSTWEVTAKQEGSGAVVKFKMKPTTFKGQSFTADLSGVAKGGSFSVKGPKNATVDANDPSSDAPGDGEAESAAAPPSEGSAGSWSIIAVNAGNRLVTARETQGTKTIRFKVDPQAFVGMKFQASIKNVGKGGGFKVVTPNDKPFDNCCTLVD